MGNSLQILHLIHSLDPSTGGVLSAVELLNQALLDVGVDSRVSDNPVAKTKNQDEWIIAHGLWQWPGRRAQETGNRYLVYPHGMLDPWFKKANPLKHLKKQLYWWVKQGSIMRNSHAVCFTRFSIPLSVSVSTLPAPASITSRQRFTLSVRYTGKPTEHASATTIP